MFIGLFSIDLNIRGKKKKYQFFAIFRVLSLFFSAAAPMSTDVLDYFMSLDIKVWEIYGMSEIR